MTSACRFWLTLSITCSSSASGGRSEERRVGEEGRSRGGPYHLKKKKKRVPFSVIFKNQGTSYAEAPCNSPAPTGDRTASNPSVGVTLLLTGHYNPTAKTMPTRPS